MLWRMKTWLKKRSYQTPQTQKLLSSVRNQPRGQVFYPNCELFIGFCVFFFFRKILNRRFPLELQSMQRYKEKEKLHISYEVYIYHISYISYIYHTKFWLEHLQILILFLHWLSPPHPTRTQTKKFWAPGRMAHGSFDGYRFISISTGTLSAGTVTSFK